MSGCLQINSQKWNLWGSDGMKLFLPRERRDSSINFQGDWSFVPPEVEAATVPADAPKLRLRLIGWVPGLRDLPEPAAGDGCATPANTLPPNRQTGPVEMDAGELVRMIRIHLARVAGQWREWLYHIFCADLLGGGGQRLAVQRTHRGLVRIFLPAIIRTFFHGVMFSSGVFKELRAGKSPCRWSSAGSIDIAGW